MRLTPDAWVAHHDGVRSLWLLWLTFSSVTVHAGAPYLLLGPMVGHTTSTNARIWVRASEPARVSVRISEREDLSKARTVKGSRLDLNAACAGELEIRELKPDTRYYYSVLLDGKPAIARPFPSFRTSPIEGQSGRVRIAFTSCVGGQGYQAAAGYADMASRTNFDLLIMLGDNHYANTNNIERHRAFYTDQRRQPGWKELTSRVPTYAIWDDHDYGPNNSDGTVKGKMESLRAFREHWANPGYGEGEHLGVYSKFTRGNVEVFLLDVRFHRTPNRATNAPHRTMLGASQLAWVKRGLKESRAPIKVLASGSEWQSGSTADSWANFKRERDDLLRFIEDNEITGVLLISGDRHFTAAYQVLGKWIEVTSGPIGSGTAELKNVPEVFLNFSATKGKYYCVYDLNTGASPPAVTLEVFRVGQGLVERRAFTWDEVLGKTRIKTLPIPEREEKPAAVTQNR